MLTPQYTELVEQINVFIHEIKNPLSTLGLNLQLLAEDFAEPQNQRERRALERIKRLQGECQRLGTISQDFLRFARIQNLDLQSVNLAEVIEELVDFFGPTAQQADIEIAKYLPADLPPVAIDQPLFKQALLNLMLNAQQAMAGGGELTILAKRTTDASGKPAIELSLIDTGKGIPPEVLAKLFRPFVTTRQGGTGLGLPTTRKIIEAHGGTIDVQSEVGRGTKFTIRLPASV